MRKGLRQLDVRYSLPPKGPRPRLPTQGGDPVSRYVSDAGPHRAFDFPCFFSLTSDRHNHSQTSLLLPTGGGIWQTPSLLQYNIVTPGRFSQLLLYHRISFFGSAALQPQKEDRRSSNKAWPWVRKWQRKADYFKWCRV